MSSSRSPLRALCALALATVPLALAACGDDNDKDKDTASTTPSQPTALNVSFDTTTGLKSPPSIDGGVVKLSFTNNAKAPYSLQMIRVEGTHTDKEINEVVNSDGGPIPTWITDGGGVGTVKPGQTGESTQQLPAGHWVIVAQPDGEGKVANEDLQVKGGGSGATLPQATAKISAFEYGFKASGLKAGNNPVEFDNTGAQLHHVVAIPLLPGKTKAQAQKFLQTQNAKGQPPLDFENGVNTTVVDSGQKLVTNLDLKSGKYVLVCFINDREGGPPHVAKGMITEVDVS